MRVWMKENPVMAMALVLVLSPLLFPAMLIYGLLRSSVEVLDIMLEEIEDWWNAP